MGNCSNCIQEQNRRSQNRTNLTPLSSYENLSHSLHRNLLTHRLTNIRTFSPYNLNALVDEALSVVRAVSDTEQEPPHALLVISRIANREDRWLDVMITLIERIPIDDPLGATVIAILLDECSLPSKELLQQLIKRICSNNYSRINTLKSIIDEYIQQITNIQSSKRLEKRASKEICVRRATNTNDDNEDINTNATTSTPNNRNNETTDEKSVLEK